MKQLTIKSILIISSMLFGSISYAEDSYTFGIVPQQSANKTAERWVPILKHISEKTGIKLNFKTAKDITAFEAELGKANYDIAYMNPFHYILYHEKSAYNAILKSKGKKLNGIIVVKKDGPVKSLQDISGKEVAFPSPNAFAASILTQADLKKNNIEFTPKYVSSHDSVYKNVVQDRFIAGGGVTQTLKSMSPEIKKNLKVLHKTKVFTPHAIAAHQRIPAEHLAKIKKAFIQMRKDPEGKKLLKKAKLKRLVKAQDKDWDDVRKLGISKS